MAAPVPPPPEGRCRRPSPGSTPEADTVSLEALTAALDELVLRGTLSADQVRAVLRRLSLPPPPEHLPPPETPVPHLVPTQSPPPSGEIPAVTTPPAGLPAGRSRRRGRAWPALLAEVGGYLGAVFSAAGCAVLVRPGWDTLTRGDRVLVLTVPGTVLLLAALALMASTRGGWVARPHAGGTPRRRLVGSAVLLAATLFGGAFAQFVPGQRQAEVFCAGALAVTAGGYLACRGALLNLATAMWSGCLLAQLLGPPWGSSAQAPWGFVLTGIVWAGLAATRLLDERTVGVTAGGVLTYFGAESLTWHRDPLPGYVTLLAVAVAWLAGYGWSRRASVLVVGVLALATVVPQAVTHYTGGALQAGGALLVTGLSIIGASMVGLLLHQGSPAHRR
ncbi:MAG TPA: hypothetical protein VFP72_01205 [Kineosporiaceae bacterium]|nr:hypothetical protein [Kineosporiaceae bacterium]